MASHVPLLGKKRRRDSGEDHIGERPRARVKTEPEDVHDNGSMDIMDGDLYDPPTPPVPRGATEEENGEQVTHPIENDIIPDPIQPGPSAPSSSRQPSKAPPFIKVEPCPSEDWEEPEKGSNSPGKGKDGAKRASVDNFFTFGDAPQIKPSLPNSMAAEIKCKPVLQPQKAHYYSHTAEEEYKYGDDESKIKTIPLHKKAKGSDSEPSDEEQDMEEQNPHTIARYFKRTTVYTRYDFESRKVDCTRLAVNEKRTQILNSIEKARVVIIEGFTGCGKTTQIPQFILDQCAKDKKVCNIVVTQPRKIAAISVARRVCYERNWNMGTVVGYQVGMETKTNRNDTLLTFMTTGVLLQKLISMKSLKDFTHIIIDEVHERDLESDFLLLVIKQIMAADTENKGKHVKLILMSATIDTRKFANYFVFEGNDGELLRPHVIKLPLVVRHKIQEIYLNELLHTKTDLLQVIESNLDKGKATIQEEIYDVAVSCIVSLDELEQGQELDPRIRAKPKREYPKIRGAVLVFLPGMEEIRRLSRALENANREKVEAPENRNHDPNFYRWVILPLHSSVTSEEQGRVFDPQGDTFRKIILSTNIAESSVTVPDISYVIDFCVAKSLCVDHSTNFTTLRMIWAAKSQCTQRRGRAGRVADGKVYRLLPHKFYMELQDEIQPEMQRSNLETIILMCKKFDMGSPKYLLSDALDRPNLSGIERAIATLRELGALTVEVVDKQSGRPRYDTCDGDLTFLGKVMSDLPIPQQCTRLIMFGHIFGVMHEAVIIAAGLSVKSPFHSGFQRQLDTYLEKMNHSKKSFSDLFALYHVYKFWLCNFAESGLLTGGRRQVNEHRWARGACVHLAVLREIKSTVCLLEDRLKRLGITDSYSVTPPTDPVELTQTQGIFLKLAIAGAFYPHYFLRRRPDAKEYERRNNREVNGLDVFRTVYFTGFPNGHKGKLYAKHVADFLSVGASTPAVIFEGQKVLASFDNSSGETIGPFNKGVFRALKLRQLRESLEFRILWTEEEDNEIQRHNSIINKRRCTKCPPLTGLPPINIARVTVKVQHIISPSQFWVVIEKYFNDLEIIESSIAHDIININLPSSKIAPNAFCLAPFERGYYRAKILRVQNENCLVYFVDYGNTMWVRSSTLQDFSPAMVDKGVSTIECLAVECRLSEIKPNIIHGLHWSEEAISHMKTFCEKAPRLEFQIFSIYQSIMTGALIGLNADGTQPCSLNDRLKSKIESGKQFGEVAVESYVSMSNHRQRERSKHMERDERLAAGREQIGDPLDLDYIQPPHNGRNPVTLKGPWSPLEMTFQALVRSSSTKEVRIDSSSVNSVILDHEPTAPTSRMLVAAHVGIADRSKAVIARDSTIMSAVPGILSLVSMLFAPKIELRIDRMQSRYTGILCGCGTIPRNVENAPVHPDNDMEIVFDTQIDDDDIDRINYIRYHMNLVLRNSRGVNKSQYHKQVHDDIIKLLRKSRRKIEEEVWPQEECVWNRISEEFLQTQIPPGMVFNHEDIFQPHRKVMLNKIDNEEVVWEGGY